jgi:hypothetical protein
MGKREIRVLRCTKLHRNRRPRRGRVRLPEGVADWDYAQRGGKTRIGLATKFVASAGVIAGQVFWGGGNAYVSRGAENAWRDEGEKLGGWTTPRCGDMEAGRQDAAPPPLSR